MVEEVEAEVAVPVVAPGAGVLEGGGVLAAAAGRLVPVGVEAEGGGGLAGGVGQVAAAAEPVFLEEAVRGAPPSAKSATPEEWPEAVAARSTRSTPRFAEPFAARS
jgi:hypothetical protein